MIAIIAIALFVVVLLYGAICAAARANKAEEKYWRKK